MGFRTECNVIPNRWSKEDDRVNGGTITQGPEPARWGQRLFLQGVEGKLLPAGFEAGCDAALVRPAAADRGDQQHLLSHAEPHGAADVGRDHAGTLPVYHQGAAAHYPHGTFEGGLSCGLCWLSLPLPGIAWRQARSGAVSIASRSEKRSAATQCFSAIAARGTPGGV